MLFENRLRGCDRQGCGHYGAHRGDRHHRGLDIECLKFQKVLSPMAGNVTKIGFPYKDSDREKRHYKYIEIEVNNALKFRIFYISPFVVYEQSILKGQFIGEQQELGTRYAGIKEHIHLEVMWKGKRVDPLRFFNEYCLT